MQTKQTKESLVGFEQRIVEAFRQGDLPFLVHLSGGNEEQLIKLFDEIGEKDWVFSSHRNHYHALLKGIPDNELEGLIRSGRSMFVFSREHRFVTSSILAGTCGMAAGAALAIKRNGGSERVWCFIGDGAEEQGHFYEAVLFVEANELPCTFIVEDNKRQVDTDFATRRGTASATQHPLGHFSCVRRMTYEPSFPHGGAGLPAGSVTFKPEVVARHAWRV